MKKNTKGTGHQSSFFYRCSLCAAGGMLMGVAAVLFLAGGKWCRFHEYAAAGDESGIAAISGCL